jgi:hypothetical protein
MGSAGLPELGDKIMSTISLESKVTIKPDFTGFNFYVEAGSEFDARDYADAFDIDYHEIDQQDIKAVQELASKLHYGWWLEVTHSSAE